MRLSVNTKHAKVRSARAATAIVLMGLCLALLIAGSAQAGDGFVFQGSLAGLETGLTPEGVAVDDATGNVLVSNRSSVLVYDAGGVSAVPLAEFGLGELSRSEAIAIDQKSHAVYVADVGANRIDRYTGNGAATPTYTLDNAFKSPVLGSGAGQLGSFATAIAVDPTTGDLLIADGPNKRVSRYAADGKFISSFDGSDSAGGAFINPQGITVDPSGNIYVVDINGYLRFDRAIIGTSRVERFDAAGKAQAELGAGGELDAARYVAFDAQRGDLVVATGGGEESNRPLVIYVMHGDTISASFTDVTATTFGTTFEAGAGLAVDGGPTGRLYTATNTVSIYGFNAVQVFDPGNFPTLEPPTSASVHGVHLSGEITPESEPVTAHFEYSTDQVHWTAGPTLPTVTKAGVVSEDVTGLLADQKYYVRLVASAPDTRISLVESFTTAIGAPEVVTLPSADVMATRASLPGTINANGLLTSYHVEYGTTEAYGSRAPVSFEDIVGQLRTPSTVNVVVEGLQPATTYHYRLVATSTAGTSYGQDQVLVTDAPDGATRAFEQVTPTYKGGVQLSGSTGFGVRADGSALTLGTLGEFTDVPAAAAAGESTYFSERSSTGWSIRSLDLPFANGILHFRVIEAVSSDFTTILTLTNEALLPGAVEGQVNLYTEDMQTGALKLVAHVPPFFEAGLTFGEPPPMQFFGSPDLSHVYAFTSAILEGSEYVPGPATLYESRNGSLVPVSLKSAAGEAIGGLLQVSLSPTDDELLAYAAEGEAGHPAKGLFLARGADVTAASVSERPGDPNTPQLVKSYQWDSDGSALVFRDEDPSGMPLTVNAPEGLGNIYRYVIDAEAGHHLEYVGTGAPVAIRNHTVLYEGGNQLLAWRAGQSHVLIPSLPGYEEGTAKLISPNGRYVELAVNSPLTSDAPSSTRQVYLFDLDTSEKHCASCNGLAKIGTAGAGFGDSQVAPTDDGEVFFETTTSLVSNDSNGQYDVYAYRAGRVHLISRGTPGTYALLAGASPSGGDVFIDTNDQLVAQDRDVAADIYDARVGGGIAAQNPDPRGSCSGNACRGVTATPPPQPLLGSESLQGTGNESPPASKPAVKSLSRSQQLTRALKACRTKRDKHKRASCERQARKRYGPKVKAKGKPKQTVKKSTNGKGSK